MNVCVKLSCRIWTIPSIVGYTTDHGSNYVKCKSGHFEKTPIHAEIDLINKLEINKKKIRTIDIIVIRLCSMGELKMSKPCNDCLHKIRSLSLKKGYHVRHIYYSTDQGSIIKTKLVDLESEPEQHISRYFRKML